MKKIFFAFLIMLFSCNLTQYTTDDIYYSNPYQNPYRFQYQYPYVNPPLYLNRYNPWTPYYYQPRIYVVPLPNKNSLNDNRGNYKPNNAPIRKFHN